MVDETGKARQQQEPYAELGDNDNNAPLLQQGIELQDIEFSYGEKPLFQGLNLAIPAGKFITIIGPSGVGKTTIIDMVTGLLAPQQGQVLVDGRSLPTIGMRPWRQHIGYVPQENFLLHDTIMKNVTLGDPHMTDQDVEDALKMAEAWQFVDKLDKGIHTIAGERGSLLSGGQRQRIMIARALVHRPRLLILDEATSALDPQSAIAISRTLYNLRGQLTLLAISHQAYLVDTADIVYLIENGTARVAHDHEKKF